MNIGSKIGAAALAIAITVGGASAAFAGSSSTPTVDGGSTGRHHLTIEQVCANKDQIVTKLTEHQTHLTARIAKMTELSQRATTNGHTERAAKIDARIAKAQARLDKVTARIAKAPEWIAAHCS